MSAAQLLTIPETAAALRTSERTVERFISRRELASVKIGRKRLVSQAEIVRFIAANTDRVVGVVSPFRRRNAT